MKPIIPTKAMKDERTLSQKMQDQEKALQRKEDRQALEAKAREELHKAAEAKQEKEGPQSMWPMLQDIRERVMKLQVTLDAMRLAKQFDHAPSPAPTVNGNLILENGSVSSIIDVPSFETCMKEGQKYVARHGAGSLSPVLKEFGVEKISKLPEEKRAIFLEKISDDKPEGL
jgi:hypothetical protein